MQQITLEECGIPAITIIDAMKLRRAAVLSFLKDWADRNGLTVGALETDKGFPRAAGSDCRMAILNVGASVVGSPETTLFIHQIRACAPNAHLVILADDENPEQVISAFRAGARGFIPAGTEPSIALQAFTFILSGGSFFPPTTLAHLPQHSCGEITAVLSHETDETEPYCHRSGRLTVRQQQVLNLLRLGKSNKLIGRELRMQEATVKVHVRQIMRKFGASNRTQAALRALETDDAEWTVDRPNGHAGALGHRTPIAIA